MEHKGIQIEVIGIIELFQDKSNQYEFLSEAILLAGPEVVTTNRSYEFSFNNVNKPHESFSGINVNCRYFLRVRIVKMLADQVKELDFMVHTISQYAMGSEILGFSAQNCIFFWQKFQTFSITRTKRSRSRWRWGSRARCTSSSSTKSPSTTSRTSSSARSTS